MFERLRVVVVIMWLMERTIRKELSDELEEILPPVLSFYFFYLFFFRFSQKKIKSLFRSKKIFLPLHYLLGQPPLVSSDQRGVF